MMKNLCVQTHLNFQQEKIKQLMRDVLDLQLKIENELEKTKQKA